MSQPASAPSSVSGGKPKSPRAAPVEIPTPRSGWISLPNTYQSHLEGFSCYGCAPDNPIGLRLQMQVHETLPLFRAPFLPSHTFSGFPHLLQGGVQGVGMDCLAEWACMYLTSNIGITTRFDLAFIKGAPVPPPSSQPDKAVAHIRELVPSGQPQLQHFMMQFVCAARPQTHPSRLVLDLRLESAVDSSAVYARGVVHMLLPSPAQIRRLLGGQAETLQSVLTSLQSLPRPNTKIIPAKPAAAASAPSTRAARSNSPASAAASPSSPSSTVAASASAPVAPRTWADLITPPALADAPGEWITVPDVLSALPDNNCVGCCSSNPSGLQCRYELNTRTGALRSWLHPSAALAGFPGMLHGGVALVPMDCLGAWAVMLSVGSLGLTATMETLYLDSAPVPRPDQRRRHSHAHDHSHGSSASCSSAAAGSSSCAEPCASSGALLPASMSPHRLLLQGELVRVVAGGRAGVAVVNLYDASDAKRAPRLCMSARMRFTFATPAMVGKLMGPQYAAGVDEVVASLKAIRAKVEADNAAKGVAIKVVPVEPAKQKRAAAAAPSKL